MEARLLRAAFVAVVLLVSMGARYRTANYIVETADPRLAQQFAEAAESYRKTLALSWLGEELPNWNQPCPMKVMVGPTLGAGGATTFTFDRGEVFGWNMSIQGSAERVLDSVLPHEITHMVFASHFRRPLPRWADEGGATSVEHFSERNKQRAMLDQFLRTGRGISFSQMFAMTEYPKDVLPLYAEGYSTAEFLIQKSGRRTYIAFLDDGLKDNNWSAALQKHYNIQTLGELQKNWLAWVKQGSPLRSTTPLPATAASPEMLASSQPGRVDPNLALRTRGTTPATPMPTAIAANPYNAKNTDSTAPTNSLANNNRNLQPKQNLVPVSEKPNAEATAALNSLASSTSTLKINKDVPYTPGSTIAVSRFSITSTGYRSPLVAPKSTALASTASPPPVVADPYRTEVSRPQPLQGPTQTTMLR